MLLCCTTKLPKETFVLYRYTKKKKKIGVVVLKPEEQSMGKFSYLFEIEAIHWSPDIYENLHR